MGLNGSELTNQPLNTIFSIFTDILGSAFWLVPVGFIAIALYIKTKEFTASSVWLMASTAILGSSNLFTDHPEMSFLYYVLTIIGFVGTVVGIYFMKK